METLSDDEIEMLYERYSLVMSEEVSKSLSETIINSLGSVGCKLLNIKNVDGVIKDLKDDKFTGKLVDKVSMAAFDTFGYYLAPVTISSIFLKHKFEETDNDDNDDDELKNKVDKATEDLVNNLNDLVIDDKNLNDN